MNTGVSSYQKNSIMKSCPCHPSARLDLTPSIAVNGAVDDEAARAKLGCTRAVMTLSLTSQGDF